MHPANVNAVSFASTGHDLVSASVDGSLLVTRDGRDSIALPSFPGGIDVLSFVPDGRVIAAGARRQLRVYDPERAQVLVEADLSFRAMSFRMSSDGHRMIILPTSVALAPPALWDLQTDRFTARLEGVKVQVFSARFVRGDREILTVGGDGVPRRWNAETGRQLKAYLGSSGFLADAALDPDGSMVVTAGGDGVLRFWDMSSGTQIWNLQAHRSTIAGVHFEGAQLVSHGHTGEISRWEFPRLGSASALDEIVRCLPVKFDEQTGALLEQQPCERHAQQASN
jgi:WD40 repeat protein